MGRKHMKVRNLIILALFVLWLSGLSLVATVVGFSLAQNSRPKFKASSSWAGKWVSTDKSETIEIAISQNEITSSFKYKSPDRTVTGKWTACKASGNTLKCKWTGDHEDATKTARRKGRLKATLTGDTLSVIYNEEATEDMNWKPGYG